MRMIYIALAVLVGATLSGCGGGGGTATTPDTGATTVTLTVPDGAAPEGVTPTVENKTVSEVPGVTGSVDVFVAAAECLPADTVFSEPVTLTFQFATAIEAGKQLALFERNDSNIWTGSTGTTVNLSEDRTTATVEVDHFSSNGYYMILTLN